MSLHLQGPVFIVGMNGSGTTMLADSLGRHPDLYVFPHEIRVLPYYLRRAGGNRDLSTLAGRRSLADEIGALKPFWHANGRRNLVLADTELTQPGVAATVDALFRRFAAAAGKSRWAEKSPMNVLHMREIAAAFPDAQFVHIVRDGRDAARSFHRRYGFEPAETVYRWKRVTRQGRQQGLELGEARYLEVRYEDLTAAPRDSMQKLCGFLGLEFDDSVLGSSMRMADDDMLGGPQTIVRNSGKWVAYFSAPQLRQLESIAGQQLRGLGYEVSHEGDRDPGRLARSRWRLQGVVRRSLKHFGRWGWAGLPGFLRTLLVSARQSITGRQ